jgi:hypothetical protein
VQRNIVGTRLAWRLPNSNAGGAMPEIDWDALRAEYDALNSRAGLRIAPERNDEMFRAFVALRDLLAVVHRPWSYADEPAFVAARLPPKGGDA